jgi:hypothetical protein
MRPDSDLAAGRIAPTRSATSRLIWRATHRRGTLDPVPVIALLVTVILCVAFWMAVVWGILTLVR